MSYCFDRPGISSTALRKWFWNSQQIAKRKFTVEKIHTIVKNYLSSGLFKFFQFAVIAIDIWRDDENEDDEKEDEDDEDVSNDLCDNDDDYEMFFFSILKWSLLTCEQKRHSSFNIDAPKLIM